MAVLRHAKNIFTVVLSVVIQSAARLSVMAPCIDAFKGLKPLL
jgi:hypothetical protein